MHIEFSSDKTKLTARFFGELDHHSAAEARERTDDMLSIGIYHSLVLDLTGLDFMDSSGIGLIMGRYKKLVPMEGEIYVCNMGISVQRIFKLSGLFKITKHSFQIDRIVNEEVTYE